MNKKTIMFPLLIIGVCKTTAQAIQIDDSWSVDAEVRLRYEYMNGFNDKQYGDEVTLGESEDGYLLSRIRLGTTYRLTPDIILKASIQDARAFGWGFEEEDWQNKEFSMVHDPQEDHLELYHTYLQIDHIGGVPLSTTIGRQRIAYGDGRVFGPGEWKNSGKWIWDAAKVSYSQGEDRVDLFYGKTILHEPEVFTLEHRWGFDGAGLYGHIAWDQGALEPILAYKHNSDGALKYRESTHYYAGFRLYDDDLEHVFYDATVIRQFGAMTRLDGNKVDVDAMGWHLDAGYTLGQGSGKVRIGAGYTYASGDDADTQKDEGFDAVFGASDKYYGRMNLMSWSNLKDAELFTTFTPMQMMKVKAEVHRFKMAETSASWRGYSNAPGRDDDHLGDEFDIVAELPVSKTIVIQTGYAHLWPGDFIKVNVPAENQSDWFFFQATFTF